MSYFSWKTNNGQRRNQEFRESRHDPHKIIHRKGLDPNHRTEITINQ